MKANKIGESARMVTSALIVGVVIVLVLFFVASSSTTSASTEHNGSVVKAARPSAPAAVFPGTGTGAIPDSTAGPQAPGTPLNITFAVTGITGAPTNVEVSMTATHTWVGDLKAVLIAPDATTFTLFGYTGATTATSFGSSSDLAGTYNFKDSASGINWWTAAAATTVAPGDYRTTVSGPTTNPAAVTNLTAAFGAVSNPNGNWTLRVTDGGAGDTGSISAATLTIAGAAAPVQHVLDFNGDGKTDYSVVRNEGGGPSGAVAWYNCYNGQAEPGCWQFQSFGLASDFFVPADYDGDNKTDIAVWRPGASGVAAFYIFQSSDSTLRTDVFGQNGDDPTVTADYTGDGKADPAVYREGATAGSQSVWYYRASSGPASGQVAFEPWGSNGDFPAPGDYNGDGKADFMIQRNGGGGQANFWLRTNGTNTVSVTAFGLPTDVIVPGDYDGDGKTDIAVVRASGGAIVWYYQRSSDATVVYGGPFGLSATDFVAQGDYDGDGKTDIAVWRPSGDTAANFFYILGSTSGFTSKEWGQNGDYPTANYNSH